MELGLNDGHSPTIHPIENLTIAPIPRSLARLDVFHSLPGRDEIGQVIMCITLSLYFVSRSKYLSHSRTLSE